MTVSLKHTFQSPNSDGPDANLVQPSNWNAEHTLTCATGKVLGRTSAGTGPVEEIAAPSGAIVGTTDTQTLTNKTLTSPAVNTATIAGGTVSGATISTSDVTVNASTSGSTGLHVPVGTTPSSPADGDVWTETGGFFARAAGFVLQLVGISFTSSGSSYALGFRIGTNLYYLQFGTFGALSAGGSTTVTYAATFSTAVYGFGVSKQASTSINDCINFLGAPGLSSASVVNGGSFTNGGAWWAFGK